MNEKRPVGETADRPPEAEAVDQAAGGRRQASGIRERGTRILRSGQNDTPGGACAEKRREKTRPEPGRRWTTRFFYPIIYVTLWIALRFYHWPTFRGRKNLPQGPCVICGNHSGFADPLWVFLLLGIRNLPWTMSRKSLFEKSAFARNFLLTFRAFPVDRDNPDMAAIKKSLSVLKAGDRLLIFPEGTRVKNGKKSEPKSGAVLLAQRAGVPLVPVYITHGRKPFRPIRIILGEAYTPAWTSRRPDAEELEEKTQELMGKVYALGNKE